MNSGINSVADTALWIAAFRAEETKREDAVFKDGLAEKLAGEKGRHIVNITPHKESMAFAMVVRTCAIDRLIEMAIKKGIDTVINLGAGMDTRPFRMDLPKQLNWIEADFPGTINYKKQLLNREKPTCNLTYLSCNLSDDAEREAIFELLGREANKALILTEGVIGYLTKEQATKLSNSIYAVPAFQYWIMDYSQGKLRKRKSTKDLQKILTNSPLQFDENDPIGFFGKHGWVVSENIYILDEADRIGRKLPLEFPMNLLMLLAGKKLRELGNKTYGYVMFEKSSEQQ